MAYYFRDYSTNARKNSTGIVNPLGEDRYILDLDVTNKSSIANADCILSGNCQTKPNITTLRFENELKDAIDSYTKLNLGNDCISSPDSTYFMHHRVALNSSGDGAEIPLLNSREEFGSLILDGSDHCHSKFKPSCSTAWKQLVTATSICLVFMLVEIIGGYLAGSLAIITDAAHLLSDLVGFLVSLFAVWVAQQAPTKRLTFGYYRAEILGALLSIVVIWVLTGVFVYLAVERIVKSDFKIHADAMMMVAAIGILINIVMGITLHGSCFNQHSHFGHSHTQSHKNQERNMNVRAAIIHVLGDFMQSVGVFISACIIKAFPEANIADPICTFIFSIVIVLTTLPVLRDSIWILLEGVPAHLDYKMVHAALSSIDGVEAVHSLHLWSLTVGQNVGSIHLVIDEMTDRDVVLERAQRLLLLEFDILQCTIQIERYQDLNTSEFKKGSWLLILLTLLDSIGPYFFFIHMLSKSVMKYIFY